MVDRNPQIEEGMTEPKNDDQEGWLRNHMREVHERHSTPENKRKMGLVSNKVISANGEETSIQPKKMKQDRTDGRT
jgi:hypothetical protein